MRLYGVLLKEALSNFAFFDRDLDADFGLSFDFETSDSANVGSSFFFGFVLLLYP